MKMAAVFSKAVLALLIVTFQSGCTGIPDGTKAVTGFNLDRYLGRWYEVARLDHRFERGLTHVTAEYSMREDGGVKVVNRGFNTKKAQWEEIVGKAYFSGATDTGRLRVSFFGPFYGGYNILELEPQEYQYALVAGPNRNYLWILSRSPQLEANTLSKLVSQARDLDFPTTELIYVDQTSPD